VVWEDARAQSRASDPINKKRLSEDERLGQGGNKLTYISNRVNIFNTLTACAAL